MDAKLIGQLHLLDEYLHDLRELAIFGREQFLRDKLRQKAAERYLQLAIETCLNMAGRILALEMAQRHVDAPDSYAGLFQAVAPLLQLSPEFTDRLVRMAKFRNRLVHVYWDVAPQAIYDILQHQLDDFGLFARAVAQKYGP